VHGLVRLLAGREPQEERGGFSRAGRPDLEGVDGLDRVRNAFSTPIRTTTPSRRVMPNVSARMMRDL